MDTPFLLLPIFELNLEKILPILLSILNSLSITFLVLLTILFAILELLFDK